MKFFTRFGALVFIFSLVSCVSLTVNVYFPATEIKEAAEEIEERVRSGRGVEDLESLHWNDERRKFAQAGAHLAFLHPNTSYAQNEEKTDLDVDIKSSVFKEIIESRTKRYKKLSPFMDKGYLGEALDGYLAMRNVKELDLKTLTEIKKLMQDENKDRKKLYEEILSANNVKVTKKTLERAGRTYAEVIHRMMEVGHYYQVPNEKEDDPDEIKWVKMTKEKKKELQKKAEEN